MSRYDFVLFDADNTLFDFDRSERRALRLALAAFSIPCSPETEALYGSINSALWAMPLLAFLMASTSASVMGATPFSVSRMFPDFMS